MAGFNQSRSKAVETKEISPLISEITGGYAYLQAFKYEGPLEFKNDIWLKVLPEEIKVLINNSLIIFEIVKYLAKINSGYLGGLAHIINFSFSFLQVA